MDVAALADLLHETAEHHGSFEAVAPPHDWWDWYAAYMDARQGGSDSEEATAAADRYMAEVKQRRGLAMSATDASPSNNGRGSDAWSRSWTHLQRRPP